MVNKLFSRVCLDASLVIKLLTKEKDSNRTALLFEDFFTQNTLIIEPNFLKIEAYSVLRKKAYLGKISERQAKLALFLFERLDFNYINEDEKLLISSYQLAKKLNQPVIYDCLYLALAKQEKATFVTADLRFLKNAASVYLNSFSLKTLMT